MTLLTPSENFAIFLFHSKVHEKPIGGLKADFIGLNYDLTGLILS